MVLGEKVLTQLGAVIMDYVLDSTLTDRHGFVLSEGNRVNNIEDDSTFIVSKVDTLGTSPVVFLLDDSKGGFVDASVVMLSEDEKRDRATFCEVRFNHYMGGVCWFKKPFNYPKRGSVYSSCQSCLSKIGHFELPDIACR